MQKITPHLWFDKEAEEAVNFYIEVFGNGKVLSTARYPDAGQEIHHMPAGTLMTAQFEIEGYRMIALNGGPVFKFTPAISFMIACETKELVDERWVKLLEGGKSLMPLDTYPFNERYGWVQDKYGVTWQLMYNPGQEQKIMPSLLYVGGQAGKAEEAMNFYISLFANSSIGLIARYAAGQAPDKEGTIMYGDFTLEGQKFAAMDSAQAHDFTFNEAVSLMVTCNDQEEIDRLWDKMSAVPEAEACGWLKDRFGVSWQIAPSGMEKVLNDPDKEKANKAMKAMLKMKKLNIAELESAANE